MLQRILPQPKPVITVDDIQKVNFYFEMSGKEYKVSLDSNGEVTGTDLEQLLQYKMTREQFEELLTKAVLFEEKTQNDIFKGMLK